MSERTKRARQAVVRKVRASLPARRPRERHVPPVVNGEARLDLAFVSFRDGNRSIWLMNAERGDADAICVAPGIGHSFDPSWSFDGATLLFISDVDGHDNVHSLELATGTVTRLTPNDADHRYPAMSPDGSSIVYLRSRWPQPPQIWMMDAVGGNSREWHTCPGYKVRPTFSPDGTLVTVQLDTPNPRIHALAVDNKIDRQSTDLSGNNDQDTYPSWSPDGTRLAFAKTERSSLDAGITSKQIWTMNADGTNAQPLVTFADARHPVWSADGLWVAFDADTADGRQVHFMSPGDQELRCITSTGDNHTVACRPT